MANNKTGLSFYRTDTDRYQDMRIKRLKKDFGCSGIAVYDYLLCEIYRVQGCFIVWDENTVFDVAEYFGLKENLVNEIITYCGVVGLFDKGLLCREKIITSRSIQQRYLNMCAAAKRQNAKIPEEIKILPEESAKPPEEPGQTSGSLPHSKVEKSKVKKNKEDIETAKAAALKRRESFFESLLSYRVRYGDDIVTAFFEYWSEFNKSQTKMRFEQQPTWETSKRLATWAKNESKFNKTAGHSIGYGSGMVPR